jgi:hypothetical protein
VTLAPLHSSSVRGVEGRPGDLARLCAVPGCISLAQQRHHLWPKSYLRGQPYEWVEVDGHVLQNTVGLCMRHHGMVTGGPGGHLAVIVYQGGVLLWAEEKTEPTGEWIIAGPLHPQPKGAAEPRAEEKASHPEAAAEHGVLLPGQTCESCGYTKPYPRQPGPKRRVSIWGVTVPDDTEIGAEVLDEWIDEFAAALGFGDERTRLRRYHVLASVLAWSSQHLGEFVADVKEAGEA